MLEFIVLGKVPGTNWQISFTTILLFWILVMLALKALRSYYRYHKFKSNLGQQLARYLLMSKKTTRKRNRAFAK